jgi:hypothetical protein
MIVISWPTGGKILHFGNRFRQMMGQPVVTHSSVVALNIGILLPIARLNKTNPDAMLGRSRLRHCADKRHQRKLEIARISGSYVSTTIQSETARACVSAC